MAKLFFKYGTVFSAKSLNLIATAHNYQTQGKKVLLLIPEVDTRSDGNVSTRAGFTMPAIKIGEATDILAVYASYVDQHERVDCILVDEVNMMAPKHIDQLREITLRYQAPVICYGLKTSFTSDLFPGTARLLALADKIEEIKTICWYCGKKATQNLKMVDGRACYEGEQIEMGGLEKFLPVCYKHYVHPPKKEEL